MMSDTTTTWLVYDCRDGKWLKEFNHPTNYVDEASEFLRGEAEKLVADVADRPWIDGRPPRVMVPDVRAMYEGLGLAGQATAVWKYVEAATEKMIADQKAADELPSGPASLADQARAAYEQKRTDKEEATSRDHGGQILNIRQALEKLGIPAAGDPFVNYASGRPCVPLIVGGWQPADGEDGDGGYLLHSVAVEWDHSSHEDGPLLVATLEDEFKPQRLFPTGRLNELADVGRALENGGSVYRKPQTASDVVDLLINKAANADAGVTADALRAEAICTALLDVAAAIREGRSS